MELDFNILESIGSTPPQEVEQPTIRKAQIIKPATEEPEQYSISYKPAKAARKSNSVQRKLDEKAEYRQALMEIAANIRESETLRTEILKGVQQGEELYTLLEKAVKCIGLMTGDGVFAPQVLKEMQNTYRKQEEIPL